MSNIVTLCRCCGNPMDSVTCPEQVQVNARGDRRIIPQYTIVTCREAGCAMQGYTFDTRGYTDVKLTEYGVKA